MDPWDILHTHTASSIFVITGLVPLIRYILHRLVFKPFGTWALANTKQQRITGNLSPKLDHRRKKLTESLWKFTACTALLSIGVRALWGRSWVLYSKDWWLGYPDQRLEKEVELYYTAELAFYGASAIMILVWEERRRDLPVMFSHHILTIFLVAFSYTAGFTRVGSVVMLLHDPSDVFLEAAKICNYLGLDFAATLCFAMLLVSWLLLRLVIFPFWLIRSTIFETGRCTVKRGRVRSAVRRFEVREVLGAFPPHSFAFIAMLCALVGMHCYWFALISRIAYQKLTTGSARDTREDED